jgi:hypothetical protein
MAAVEDNSMAIGKPIWMKLFMAFYLLKGRCMGRLLVRVLLDRKRKDLVDGYGFAEEIWSLRKSKGEANVISL